MQKHVLSSVLDIDISDHIPADDDGFASDDRYGRYGSAQRENVLHVSLGETVFRNR